MNARKTLAALAAAGACLSAQAIELQFDHLTGTVMTAGDDKTTATDYTTGSLQYTTASGASFEAFCVELAQGHARQNQGLLSYGEQSFTGVTATLLQGLFSSSYGSLDSDWKRGAFQLAVWEITHETQPGPLSVSNGVFQFQFLSQTSTAAEDQAMADLANSYLNAAAGYSGPDLYTVTKLTHGNAQDLVAVSPVPEPTTYALMIGGLLVLGLRKRRDD